jgi:phosphoserine phosphatase RsbU/P
MSGEKKSKILVLVDEKFIRENIASHLSKQGYLVSQKDPAEPLRDSFHSDSPDLIVCDIGAAGSKSFDILNEIMKLAPALPVVVLANKENTEQILEAMRLGASDYFIKPVDDMVILELSIQSNLERARVIEENLNYRKKLEVINQELETSLEIFRTDQQAGRHVQVSMLPQPPQTISAYRFNHRVIPSLFLSGDSVDYKPVSKHKVMFYIADVSGHGSSSAFVTVLLRFRIEQMRRDYIRSRFASDFTPASILASLNKDLLDSNLDKHITLFIGLLDEEDNSLTYSVAGHHPLPVIYSDVSDKVSSSSGASFINLKKSSFPIGLLEEAEYFEEKIILKDNFSLTLFSDGILETMNMASMSDKESYLLKVVADNKGEFEGIKNSLGLNSISNVPDDIAVMNVSVE